MSTYKKLILFISVIIIFLFAGGIIIHYFLSNKEDKFQIDFDWEEVKFYSKYQQDFLYLCQLLWESHPSYVDEIGSLDYEKKEHFLTGELELVTSRLKLAMILQKYISQLDDGHTQIYFEQDLRKEWLPYLFSWSGENLVINNVNRGENLGLIGAKVKRIGNIPADSLEQKLGCYVSAENKYWRRVQLARLLNNVEFLEFTGIGEPDQNLKIEVDSRKGQKILTAVPVKKTSWLIPRKHPVTALQDDYFSYSIQEDINVCYFQFNQFYDSQTARIYHEAGIIKDIQYNSSQKETKNNGGDFRIFLEKMFNDIQNNNIETLVIDLRNNMGGNSILANQFYYHIKLDKPLRTFTTSIKLSQLMKHYYPETVQFYLDKLTNDFGIKAQLPYLYDLDLETQEDYFALIESNDSDFYLPKPKFQFAGRLIFLTSNQTFSSAGDMVTIAYDNGIGTVIGQPMGQKPTSYGDILYFTLPKTGIKGGVSHKIFNRPMHSRNNEKTIIPDYTVIEDPYEVNIQGIDRVWEKTLEIINQDEFTGEK